MKALSETILIAGSNKSSGLLAKNSAFRYHGLAMCSRFGAVQATNNSNEFARLQGIKMLTPVLLSGGVGSRLWPVSRETHPKQFLPLAGEISMLQETLRRTTGLEAAAPLVVCNEEHRFMVAEQLRQLNLSASALILEPQGRNTAPAVALAALQAIGADPESILLVLPADHLIRVGRSSRSRAGLRVWRR